MFQLQLRQAEEAEKKVVLGSGVSVGDEVMSVDQIGQAQVKREDQYRLHQRNMELDAMQR